VKGVVFLVVISEVAELITHWTNDASPVSITTQHLNKLHCKTPRRRESN